MGVREDIADGDDELLFADGLDEALIGKVQIWGMDGRTCVALYDLEACVRILMTRDGMDEDGAREFLEFNTLGAYAGSTTPAYATIMRTADGPS